MAHSSLRKLPRGKADSYTLVSLSDQKLAAPLLSGLSIATCNPSEETDVKPVSTQQVPKGNEDGGDVLFTVSTRMSCTCCASVFSSRAEQKAHFKSDWHRYNLKQQLKGDDSITEDQFESMTGEVSSISGSDDTTDSTDDEDSAPGKPSPIPQCLRKSHVYDSTDSTDSESEETSAIMASTRRHPKVFVRNESGQLLSLYRCVLHHKKNSPSTPAELLSLAVQAKTYHSVAVVMLAGGHFSASIFDGTDAVVHKTFHRYVVRAKRGTVQSVRDSQGSAPKSGGASLRRYNEAALAQEIQELLSSWSQHLKSCQLIFLRTSTYSRKIFFGGKSPVLSKGDVRIRTIPFSTGRPTFNEAKRVHQMLMTIECFGEESLVTDFVPMSPPRHLHPATGQLVVRPDTAQSRSPQKKKIKDKKEKENMAENRIEKSEMVASNEDSAATTDKDAEEDDQSEKEIELVEVVMETSTDHLQEFAVSVPKQNRKKKKKGGQKTKERETTPAESNSTDTPELSEEDLQLKNRLYTCCRAGDLTQLSELLEHLRVTDSQQQLLTVGASGAERTHDDIASHITHGDHHDSKVEENTSEVISQPLHSVNHCSTSATICDTQNVTETKTSDNNRTNADTISTNTVTLEVENNTRTEQPDSNVDMTQASEEHSELKQGEESGASSHMLSCDSERERRFQRLVLGKYGEKELSLLHIAATAGHADLVTALLEAGCDPALRDNIGKTAYSAAVTKDARNAFRRFRGNYPVRYDYDVAQIPTALTAEIEADRKQREAEKKKAQKKAKQERLKERKAEEMKASAEKREKGRFLALSDREKRALAAEKRLVAQSSAQGASSPVLNRCYQCGTDITSKVPFEYMEFQFCAPKCLKEHRIKHSK